MVDKTDLTNCGGVGTVMEDFRILDIAVVWTLARVTGFVMRCERHGIVKADYVLGDVGWDKGYVCV